MAEQLQFAGDYQLQEIVIHSNSAPIDVKNLMIELNIYESIHSNAISGSLVIADSANHRQNIPIVGQEEISFKLEIGDENEAIDFTQYRGRIYKISDQVRTEDRQQVYTLFFVAKEKITNARTRVQQAFEGSSDQICTQVLKNVLKTNKLVTTEPSILHTKLLGNNTRPFEFIKQLTKRSESALNSNAYLFYENHRGYHFRSIASLHDSTNGPRKEIIEYTHDSIPTARDVEKGMHSLLEYTINKSQDILASYHSGLLASRSYNYNISRKSYTIEDYNYFTEFEKRKHTNKFPIFSTTLEEEQRTLSDYPLSSYSVNTRNEYLHTQSESDTRDYNNHSNKNKNRTSDLLSHDQMNIKCTVQGNTNLAAGDVVILNIPSLEPINSSADRIHDAYISGRYVLMNVVHALNDSGYTTTFDAISDSVETIYTGDSTSMISRNTEKNKGTKVLNDVNDT